MAKLSTGDLDVGGGKRSGDESILIVTVRSLRGEVESLRTASVLKPAAINYLRNPVRSRF